MGNDKPIEYKKGFTYFLGIKIDLSERPLIPRKETEFWTKKAITDILTFYRMLEYSKNKKVEVLDIFSGSGCIGLAVLKYIKSSRVTFADKDEKCLKQIRKNIKLNFPFINKNRVKVVKSDIFSKINKKFDYILANPPYVALKNIEKVQPSVLKYEPHSALFGGKDGLFYIKKFLKEAKKYLKSTGKIFMEFSPEQKEQMERLLKRNYSRFKFYKDQYCKWRYVVIE